MTGLYPAYYYIVKSVNPGILAGKSAELLSSYFYRGSFYTHITFGGIALLIGWMQFSKKIRAWNINLHRGLGKAYMTAVALSGIAGFTVAMSATGGPVSMAGFGLLAVLWLYTDFRGYRAIRRLDIGRHRAWMLRNYSLTFAAVTLRDLFAAGYGGYASQFYSVVSGDLVVVLGSEPAGGGGAGPAGAKKPGRSFDRRLSSFPGKV